MLARFATWLIDHRGKALAGILLVTTFFAYQLRNLQVETRFHDLLPTRHPYIQLFNQYSSFTNPLEVQIIIEVKEGTVFNQSSLEKVSRITLAVDFIPGVNHSGIYSLASRQVTHVARTKEGIEARSLMPRGLPPQTEEEVGRIQQLAFETPGVIGVLVSRDLKAAIIRVGFLEYLDYTRVFQDIQGIVQKEGDHLHTLHAVGDPILVGWVYYYERETLLILALTLVGIVLLLFVYMRGEISGVIVPIFVAAVSSIWGLGLVALLGINFEPLTLVVPMLIIARSFSHGVQATQRFFEEFYETRDRKEACLRSFLSIFPPGTLGIITDAIGLFSIMLAPIPVMQKLALSCGLWALVLIPANVFHLLIILSYCPPPANVDALVVLEKEPFYLRALDRLLRKIGDITHGKAAWITGAVVLAVVGYTGWQSQFIVLGHVRAGSNLLYANSPYNIGSEKLNRYFAGTDALQVVIEGTEILAVESPQVLNAALELQRRMARDPWVGGTASQANAVPAVHRLIRGGNPKWAYVPSDRRAAGEMFVMSLAGKSTDEFASQVDPAFQNASITIWYRGRTQEVIDRALSQAQATVQDLNTYLKDVKLRLATGMLGIQAAINESVANSQVSIHICVLLAIFISCWIGYRSPVAGVILLIPVLISDLIVVAIMVHMGIGMDVNSLPIGAVGAGIGIDYGIYMLSRICEEYQKTQSYSAAIPQALATTGRAIFFTATVVLLGVLPWYFFSPLKFQADMGLLVGFIMMANMVNALIVLPLLMTIFQPKFAERTTLIH